MNSNQKLEVINELWNSTVAIVDNGIVLAGGGAMLTNLDILIKERIGLPVILENDPLTSVIRGCGELLKSENLLRQLML